MLDLALFATICLVLGLVSISFMAIVVGVSEILAFIVWPAMGALKGYMEPVYEPILRGYVMACRSTAKLLIRS